MKTSSKQHRSSCAGCDTCGSRPEQLGLDLSKWDYVVALAGNPNTGKSTVFNRLTGLRQHTGNWPGKTVTRAEGSFGFEHKQYKLLDLPGTYSLLSASVDEEIARNFILFGRPDCTVVVVDATCLERNLNLVLQILEITDKAVVALNLMDEAKRKGMDIDARSLARDLGVPVAPIVARSGQGFSVLLQAVAAVVTGQENPRPHRVQSDGALLKAVNELIPMIETICPGLANVRWVAMRLLAGDHRIQQALLNGELNDTAKHY